MINSLIEAPPRDHSHGGLVWPQAGRPEMEAVDFSVASIFQQNAPHLAAAEKKSIILNNEIVWGRLCLDTLVSEVTDLSGSISKNRGAEIIQRVIRLTHNHDFHLPPTDRQGVKWASESTVLIDCICEDTVVAFDGPVLDKSTLLDFSPESDTGVSIVEGLTYLETEPVASFFTSGPQRSTFVAPLPDLRSAPLEKLFVSTSPKDRLPAN